ncbi:MAG: anti-sigma factor antagonist [Candidatus Hydrogenedentota bacterium]|nr:MAG: anti-sigma factor antagonist [Candidatus Hydrogenedentota bacterium]
MTELRVSTEEKKGVVVIHVDGRVDAFLVTKIREIINDLVQAGKLRLVIEFAKVSQINSTALGILVGRLRRVRMHGGDIKITGLNQEIRRIFDVMGAAKIFDVHDSVDAACKAFSRTMYNGEMEKKSEEETSAGSDTAANESSGAE